MKTEFRNPHHSWETCGRCRYFETITSKETGYKPETVCGQLWHSRGVVKETYARHECDVDMFSPYRFGEPLEEETR